MLSALRRGEESLAGCTAGLVVTGQGELYTKDVARDLVLSANMAGCAFLGRPLVEATGSLRNFRVQAEIRGTDEAAAFALAAEELIDRLHCEPPPPPIRRLTALHASSRTTSNTLALWDLVRRNLPADIEVTELGLRNGTVSDCNGCAYTTCLHFGEQGGCFYGGPMVDEVFPAVRECDALVMLCANYNDALSANLTAFVNRLTALFRQNRFYDKRLYGLIVSGYSGGDLIAQLKGRPLGDRLLIPVNMLRHGGDVFLDDLHVSDVESALGVPVTVVEQDGFDLLDAILGRK